MAMKSALTGQLLVICNECESQWTSPDEAQSFENALSNEIHDLQKASLDEIKERG